MPAPITTTDLVRQVRSGLDETNSDVVTDQRILDALNRAQDYAHDVLARYYAEPLVTYAALTLADGQAEYDLPVTQMFEDRLLKVEVNFGAFYREVTRLSYRQSTTVETSARVASPLHYSLFGRKMKFYPTPNASRPLRVWYLREVETLVPVYWRLTSAFSGTGAGSQAIVSAVDSAASAAEPLNVVDQDTGEVKATIWATVSGTTLTFTGSVAGSPYYGKPLNALLPTMDTAVNATSLSGQPVLGVVSTSGIVAGDIIEIGYGTPRIETLTVLSVGSGNITFTTNLVYTHTAAQADLVKKVLLRVNDLLCPVTGTCIPFFKKPLTNFMIEASVLDLKRALGEAAEVEMALKKDFEEQIKKQYFGREPSIRVKKQSRIWRRYIPWRIRGA